MKEKERFIETDNIKDPKFREWVKFKVAAEKKPLHERGLGSAV